MTNPKGHIRAFAAEVLTAVMVLWFMLKHVVLPRGIASLEDHIDAFHLLYVLLALLCKGDPDDVDSFERICQLHHELFFKLYMGLLQAKVARC